MMFMQDTGIVHRDLKTSNVLLENVPLNSRQIILRAVICDFGLARVTSSVISVDGQKFKDIGGYSPRYAAPEVLANTSLMITTDPEQDKKSDVYSFAIIIWEMITRRTPWEGMQRGEIERNVRTGVRVRSFPSIHFACSWFL